MDNNILTKEDPKLDKKQFGLVLLLPGMTISVSSTTGII